jgi:hypothetical protein
VHPFSSGSYLSTFSGLGGPTSSYATAGIALTVSGALKPHHHDKVEIASVGIVISITTYLPETMLDSESLFSEVCDAFGCMFSLFLEIVVLFNCSCHMVMFH